MAESFSSWTKTAASAASKLRARAAEITGLPLVPRADEAWEVDLEAAIWKRREKSVADVDLEAGLPWRGRTVVSEVAVGSSRRRTPSRRARATCQPKSRPVTHKNTRTPRTSSPLAGRKADVPADVAEAGEDAREARETAIPPSQGTVAPPPQKATSLSLAAAIPKRAGSAATAPTTAPLTPPTRSELQDQGASTLPPPSSSSGVTDPSAPVGQSRSAEMQSETTGKVSVKAAPPRKFATARPDLDRLDESTEANRAANREGLQDSSSSSQASASASKALDNSAFTRVNAEPQAPTPSSSGIRSFQPIAPVAGVSAPPVSVPLRTAGLGKPTRFEDVQKITVLAPSPAKAKALATGAKEAARQTGAEASESCDEGTPRTPTALAVPTRNKEQLGALQCGGCTRDPVRSSWQEGLGGAVAVPVLPASWTTDLPESGIDPGPIASWLEGRLSWTGCYCRIIDGLRRYTLEEGERPTRVAEDAAADMGWQARKILAEHIGLHAPSSLLAFLAGGTPSMLAEAKTLEGLLPRGSKEKPAQALTNAYQWFIGGLGLGPEGLREGGGRLQMALAFRRLQLRAHPVQHGSQRKLLEASISLETLRAAGVAQRGGRMARCDDVGRELTDHELLLLIEIQSQRDDRELEAQGFLDPPRSKRLFAYARSLEVIRKDLKGIQKSLSLDNARQVLGLSHSASTEQLTKAYRKKALQLHPDRCGEASTEAFQSLQDAYQLLLSHADRIARASEVDVVPKIGPNETVVPGVEFKLPKESGADDLAFKADIALKHAQTFLDMQLLTNKPSARPARAHSAPSKRTLDAVLEESDEGDDEDDATDEPDEGRGRAGEADENQGIWRTSSRHGRSNLLLYCAGQVRDTGRSAAEVGNSAVATQSQVMPLIQAVKELMQTMPDELFGDVIREANKCLSQITSACALGHQASQQGIGASNKAMQYNDSNAFWEPQGESGRPKGREVMDEATQAALNCAAAVMALHDGFEASHRLAALLTHALNMRAKNGESDPPPIKERLPKEEDLTDAEKRRRLLRIASDIYASNLEMLQWQRELRDAVRCRPNLLDPVSVWEKEALFSMASEVLEGLKQRLAECDPSDGFEPVEAILSVTLAAASLRRVASPPSIEARLLRLAALIHATALVKLLEEFFSFCLADLGNRCFEPRDVNLMKRRCDQAVGDLKFLQVDGSVQYTG